MKRQWILYSHECYTWTDTLSFIQAYDFPIVLIDYIYFVEIQCIFQTQLSEFLFWFCHAIFGFVQIWLLEMKRLNSSTRVSLGKLFRLSEERKNHFNYNLKRFVYTSTYFSLLLPFVMFVEIVLLFLSPVPFVTWLISFERPQYRDKQ